MQEILAVEDSPAEWQQLRPLLDQAMDELGARDREAILLRFFQGQSFERVGAALDLSEEAARKRVERSLGKLRELLARRGIVSSSAALVMLLTGETAVAAPAGLAPSIVSSVGSAALTPALTLPQIFFTSMSATKFVVLGIYVWAAFEFNQIRELRGELARLDTGSAALTRQIRDLQAQQASLANASRRPRELPASAIDFGKLINNEAELTDDLFLNDPMYQNYFLQRFRSQIKLDFGVLFRTKNFTSDQIKRFEDALVEHEKTIIDLAGAARKQGLPNSDPVIADQIGTADSQLQTRLQGLVAPEELQSYNRVGAARSTVLQLAENVGEANSPLDARQSSQLTELLLQNSPSFQAGKNLSLDDVDWTSVLSQSQSVLSYTQIQSLREIVEERRADEAFYQAYTTALRAGKGRQP